MKIDNKEIYHFIGVNGVMKNDHPSDIISVLP